MEEVNRDYDIPLTAEDSEKVHLLAEHYRDILKIVGEDPDREGLRKTPMRAAKALWFATQGYRQKPQDIMRQAIFEYAGSRMVVVRDIEFYSICEHHLLPFFGTADIGYIPDGNMIGLSKLARVVNAVARKFQVQERLTAELCRVITDTLSAHGVIVALHADHLCMRMRGVEKQLAKTDTIEYSGRFATDPLLRQEFYSLLSR